MFFGESLSKWVNLLVVAVNPLCRLLFDSGCVVSTPATRALVLDEADELILILHRVKIVFHQAGSLSGCNPVDVSAFEVHKREGVGELHCLLDLVARILEALDLQDQDSRSTL